MGACSSADYRRGSSQTSLNVSPLLWQRAGSGMGGRSSSSLGEVPCHEFGPCSLPWEMTYPMFVVPLEAFMKMTKVEAHEELLEEGTLVKYSPSMGDVIFVSHQWTGYAHPDPHFHQLRVLQQALTNLLAKKTTVYTQFMNFVVGGSWQKMSSQELSERDLFLWYDFFACPQLEARSNGQIFKPSLQQAVDSIPCYVQMSRFFFVLAPVMEHADSGELLSKHTWKERGWCRTERVARELTSMDTRMVVVESAEHQYLMVPFDSWLRPAGEGQFTVASDGERVSDILHTMLRKKLQVLLERQDIQGYRLLLNLQHVHLQRRLGEARTCSAEPIKAEESVPMIARFLEENRFKRLSDRELGWTPACFAALRGDAQLLKAMLHQRANLNERVKSKILELHVDRGMSLLHLAAQFGNNEVLQMLIQEKADLTLQDQLGCGPLHRAALGDNGDGVRLLLEARCDPNCRERLACLTPVGPAAAWGSTRGLRALMKHSASVELRWALHMAVLGEGSSTELVTTLISAGADLDERFQFSKLHLPKLFKALQLVLKQFHGPSISFVLANVFGATPLTCSLLVGSFEAAAALLAAKADVDRRNACGASPMEIARAVDAPSFVMHGLRGDLEDCIQIVSSSDSQELFLSV